MIRGMEKMSKLGVFNGAAIAIWSVISKYPAVSAGLVNIAVVVGAKVGLNLSATTLVEVAGAAAAILAILVHMGVIPVTKVDNVKAGIAPTVKGKASMLSTPMSGDDSKVPDALPRLNTMPESLRAPFGPQ
jgi:hypothetical protein